MDNLKFSELKDNMLKYSNGSVSYNDFNSWIFQNIKIKKYINIIEKYAIIKMFLLRFNDIYMNKLLSNELDIDLDFVYMQYEIMSTFNILFSYTNVEVDIDDINSENYDLLQSTGLYEYIYNLCKIDYDKFVSICDKVSGIDSLNIISKINDVFDKNPTIDDFNNAISKFEKVIKNKKVSQNLKFINDIELFNNPLIAQKIKDK